MLARVDHLLMLPPSPAHSQELDSMIAEQQLYLDDHPSDISTLAVLSALHSARSPADGAHARFSSSLPTVSSFTKTIDALQLESQGIPSAATYQQPKRIIRTRPRKRRVRGGKVFDPTEQVDPERWLPLRERSYYKPSKSKKRKTGGATQGGAMEPESLSIGSVQADSKKADGKKKKKGRK